MQDNAPAYMNFGKGVFHSGRGALAASWHGENGLAHFDLGRRGWERRKKKKM